MLTHDELEQLWNYRTATIHGKVKDTVTIVLTTSERTSSSLTLIEGSNVTIFVVVEKEEDK